MAASFLRAMTRSACLLAFAVLNAGAVTEGSSGSSPQWGEASIRSSRVETPGSAALPPKPRWLAAPMNLILVVEAGDDHVSIVDGDRFEVIHRFASRSALHGELKFTQDGRFVYFGTRDGWVTKYDLWNLTPVAEVHAGLEMRKLALSGDGHWVIAANDLPRTLMLFDADLNLVRSYPAATLDGRSASRVAAVYDATPRHSFIVAMNDIPELWEISYDPKAEPIFDGLVHDYRMGEGLAKPGFLGVRRTLLDEPVEDFFFDPSYRHVVGSTRSQGGKPARAQVVNLDVRRRIAEFPLPGMPHLASGISFAWEDTVRLALPNLQDGALTVLESMLSPGARDTITIIDKRRLEAVAQVREPGRTLSHIGFTRDGRYALVSLSEMEGALIIYDAQTFREIKRLPMSKPVGMYSVGDKLPRFEGGSR